jgi:hypothetical protein
MTFAKQVLNNGGSIHPILIDLNKTNGTGIFNPSVYYDSDVDKLYFNVRHCQVTLYHSENGKFENFWGPLHYCHPENDLTLTTTNYFGELNKKTFDPIFISKVDTSKLDVKPIWNFVGLEDCRIAKWDNNLYLSGVRRDTTPNGQGRIELSGITINEEHITEVSRYRLQPPFGDSYCEKNWMPIVDKPWQFVKWCNPTEIVEADISNNKTTQIFHSNSTFFYHKDFRGGSQVIKLNDKYNFCCVHTVNLFKSEQQRKNAIYRHCFIVWDENWNVVNHTPEFTFLDAKIEFCAGMTKYKNNFLISFGYQDNASYILKVPENFIENICIPN